MVFIIDFVEAAVDIVVTVVEIIVQIVEVIIEFIMTLLGFTDDQTIEYFEVHNIPLFDNTDNKNPLVNLIVRSVLKQEDLAGNLIYGTTFRSLKGDLRKFMAYIDDGNYFEGFPAMESYISYPDYTELTDVLTTLNGAPCTPELSYTQALTQTNWVQSYLQENNTYDVGANDLGAGEETTSTTPASTSSSSEIDHYNFRLSVDSEVATEDSVTVNAETPVTTSPASTSHDNSLGTDFFLNINDEVATSDNVIANMVWHIDFGDITYNSGPDNYTVGIYNDEGSTTTVTIPSKPTQLHYVSYYYIDSAPSRQYIFIYKVGIGTYPTLDDPQNEINLDATVLEAVPAIPLRIANVDYTTLAPAKVAQIDELCELVSINANDVLDSILNDPDAVPGDIDNVYITFGIRMWDTSQTGLSYLFTMFENIFPAQGVTEGDYNNAAAGETKPTNSIIVTTEDYKSVFQFAYCTFEHTTLAWIDANTGSEENAIYYSDLSKFNDSNILVWPYFSSSGKGTYNVGYKADDLAEVALFMAGNGVVNPGDTSGEATNWLQVTTRIGYNNPTPVLQDADGSTSALIYLTPDLIYQNASGTLRHVEAATEETTKGQSITYYKITPSGLNAYKVFSPIGLLRVEDGDTGKFKMVKFNLGAKEDLMVPFVHNFIRDLSHAKVSQLFLAGAHASIYIAHYEVIESSGFGGLFMIILIIVIVVIAWQVAPSLFGSLQAGAAAGANTAATMTINGVVTPITLTKVGGATTATLIGGGAVPAGIATTVAPLTGIVSTAAISAGGAVGAFSIAWGQTLFNMAINFAVNQIVKTAVTAVAGDNPKLAAVLGIAAAVGMNTVGFSGGKVSFKMPDFKDIFKIFANAASNISVVAEVYVENETKELEKEYDLFRKDLTTRENFLKEIYEGLLLKPNGDALSLLEVSLITTHNPILAEDYNTIYDSQFDSPYIGYDQESTVFDPAISVNTFT